MSIINEALKKTEEHLQKKAAKEKLLPPKPFAPKPFLLYILILLIGLLLGNLIFTLLRHKLQGNSLVSTVQNQEIQTMPTPNPPLFPVLLSPPAEEKKPIETNFVLNGIFFSDNGGYALINNQIVRENDFVDGAKVGLITANRVQLDNAGQTITLTTSR